MWETCPVVVCGRCVADIKCSTSRTHSLCLFHGVLYSENPAGIHRRGRPRRGGRAAECGGLLNRCRGQNSYRGFESPPLRQISRTSIKSVCLSSRKNFVPRRMTLPKK